MDVLQVSKYYAPTVGGLEQVVQTLAEALSGSGVDVRVLAATPPGEEAPGRVDGVPVSRARSLGELASVPVAPGYPARLARLARRADLVHVHLPNPLAVASYQALGPRDPPLVVTYHSDIVRQATALRAYRPLLEQFLSRADRILPTSPRLLEHSAHLAPHADRCEVVPLAVDPDRFAAAADGGVPDRHGDANLANDPDLPGDPDRPTLLFVGRLAYYKGVEHLVDAMAEVDADLLVVGDGERRDAVERRVRVRGVTDRVHLLGRVPDDRLVACYRAADVFVLPSVAPSEAFGVVQLEAMAAGTPVVNTDLPTGVPWVSRDGETGLTVPPGDPDALALAIDRLLDDPDRRRRYGEQAALRVREQFSREAMVDRVRAVYADLR